MWRWLVSLFVGHDHHWKVIDQKENVCVYGKGTRYYLQCEKCGITKVRDPWA